MTTPKAIEFCLVRGDLPSRLQRRMRLMPGTTLGVARRISLLVLITWLPIWLSAWLLDHGMFGRSGEPLASELSVHFRCLVALPMFVLGELTSAKGIAQCLLHLQKSQLVDPSDLKLLLTQLARLRDSALPWVVVLTIAVLWAMQAPLQHELTADRPISWELLRQLGFASFWYLYIVLPIFVTMLLGWLWRILLWGYALVRLSRLPLALVPTHPDRAFGLGFLERLPLLYLPLLFAISGVLCATWAHQVLYHGARLISFRLPALIFVVLTSVVVVAPLFAFALPLSRAKRQALPDYGALVAEHGRKVRQRWILKCEPSSPELLSAPELGPVADTISLFAAVASARIVPIGKITLLLIAAPIAPPLLALAMCQIPLREIMMELVHALT